jgi:ubiquinone/menaquinone biosynthesis C-methylase UbiE
LVDSSIAMLERACRRVSSTTAPAGRAFVQADLFDLPFRPNSFSTVACHGLLHLFDDIEAVLRVLRGQLAPGGMLYATSLVAETSIGRRWLALMHRSGEIAAPRTAAELTARAGNVLGESLHVTVRGSMAFLIAPTA